MQTIDFVQTARWIIAQIDDETKQTILGGYHFDPEFQRHPHAAMNATINLAVATERLGQDAFAREILEAFNLPMLLDRQFAVRLATLFNEANIERMVRPDRGDRPEQLGRGELFEVLRGLSSAWSIFERSIEPVERLIVPADISAETDFDGILTLELRYDDNFHPKAETVADVLTRASLLYAVVSRASGASEYPPLLVIYADSGSAVRFDLRGIAESIKEVKEFLVELWNRLRHRKADDFRANADALLVGLKVVAALKQMENSNAISAEDCARFKHDILEAGVGLFEDGALPREIPRVEKVSNQQILSEVQRKLLPAGKPVEPEPERKNSEMSSRKAVNKPASKIRRSKKRAG